MKALIDWGTGYVARSGSAVCFLGEITGHIARGRIRWPEVLKQMYEQGIQSVMIIVLTSLASGAVLALQGYTAMVRFGAKEYIAHLVGLSLVRELGPVFTALIFPARPAPGSRRNWARWASTIRCWPPRAMGVDPVEFLVVPRMVACFLVLPILTIIGEIVGITGDYLIATLEAGIPGTFYINQTIKAIQYVDFWGGFLKVFFLPSLSGGSAVTRDIRPKAVRWVSGGSPPRLLLFLIFLLSCLTRY